MSNSRKVILFCAMSLDGYIARKDGDLDWMVRDPDYNFMESFDGIDVYVMGRKSLEEGVKSGASKSTFGGKKAYVFTRAQRPPSDMGFDWVTCSPGELIAELKSHPGENIMMMGGGELAREFLIENLVDRLELSFMPVLLGDGIPLFPPGFPQRNFHLTKCQSYEKTGLITMSYERAEKKEKKEKAKRKNRSAKN